MEAEARSFPLLSTDSVLGTLPPSPLFIFITTPGVCIRSPLLVLRNETQGCWVICLRLQTSVTERAWDQDNLVEAPFISFYGALLPGTCLCHHFSLFLLLLLFMCLRVYLYFMFVYVYILSLFTHFFFFLLFPGGSVGEIPACNTGDPDSIPGSGRFPGEGNGNPLQYSCLENSTDRGAWQATVHGIPKSQTGLSN